VNTTTTKWIDVDKLAPLGGAEIWPLARAEYLRMLSLLRSLDDGEWPRPTDCPAWTVRDMLGHLVGACEGFSNPLELLHQQRAGARLIREGHTDGKQPVDGANAVQVAERADRPVAELLDRYEAVVEPTLRWRRRLRHLPVRMQDVAGPFTFRQLFEVILTRDTWMHRLDIARSTGRPFEVSANHDGRLLSDAVRDWAGHHGRPFRLHLTGPAGGYYRRGEGGEEVILDALEFGRLLSGRGRGEGLLATRIVF
jgi:uncharacterized protein (TIGR03083 family)